MLTVTATNLPRLMACNGSRLMTGFEEPVVETDDTVKDEGNAADWLVAQVHSGQFTAEELVDRKAPNGVYITAEMVENLEDYLKWIATGGHVELDTSFGGDTWQINGRTDHAIYHEDTRTLHISDLKYGWRIVEPNNWTMISHAIGWVKKYGTAHPVENIILYIYQPRPHHPAGRVRAFAFTQKELQDFYSQVVNTMVNPSDVLHTGDHCYKCPALAHCPAARKAQFNAIDASEQAFVDTLDNDTLAFQIDHLKRAQEMLKQLEKSYADLALHKIKKGEPVNGYSVDADLANTSWKDHVTPEMILSLTGKDVSKKQLITPNQAKKAGVSEDIVAAFTERRQKGFKLIKVDANTKAQKMFGGAK